MDFAWYMALIILILFAFRFVKKGDKKSFRQAIGAYILWAFVNLVVLVSAKGDSSDFWPISGNNLHYDYDFSEFLVYVGGPIVYIFIRRFFL